MQINNEDSQLFNIQEINIQDYLRTIMKHRWTVVTLFAVIFISVVIFTFTATPIYQATTRIIIEKDDPKVVSIQEVMQVDSSGLDYYQTQYKIIESRSVAREVIKRLNLAKNEEFAPREKESLIGNVIQSVTDAIGYIASLMVTEPPKKPVDPNAESEEESKLVSAFIKRVKVVPIRNSRLVDIGFQAKDPALATSVANSIARAYIDLNLETKLKATQEAMTWLNSRIEDERKKVDQAEQALLKYKERHNIITGFSKDSETVTEQKLAALNTQVTDAEVKRVEAETRYRQALDMEDTPDMLDSIPEVLSNELIRQIKTMEVELQKKQSELSKKYGAKHPQIVALTNEQETLKKRKAEEVKRVINSLFNTYKVAQARERSIKASLNRLKGESFQLNEKAIDYNVLRREAESTKEMYDLVIKRFKETSMTENIRTGNIRVVDPAEMPKYPVSPKKMQNMLLGLIVGLMFGVGMAFFLEYLDNTINTPDDLKERLKVPYLGPVPIIDLSSDKNKGRKRGKGESDDDDKPPESSLITIESPKSTASESFRGIRTALFFSSADNAPRTILVTSAAPGEGKTNTAANVAVTMAQAGNRVVIIDCDMRRPKLHRMFNISRDRGVSNVLVGNASCEDVVIHTQIPGLDVIPSGPVPPNPSEMLGSHSMVKMIERLRDSYDHVLIDSPPITAVTDAVVISRMVDGVLVVVRAGETHREIVKNAIGLLKSANAHVLGAVLNGVDMGRDSYYYYQYYYYYYGDDGEKKKKMRRKRRAQSRYYSSDRNENEKDDAGDKDL